MSILFGHPTGNPISHHAALAHWERARLEAFCVPWMPTPAQLKLLGAVPGLGRWLARLKRRSFAPLVEAPRVEGRWQEWRRMAKRVLGGGRVNGERLSNEANEWLMHTMKRECARAGVTAVHAYEDCSLWSFEEAKRLGRACIYDMPIGYYPAWQQAERALLKRYGDWLPPGGAGARSLVPVERKMREMELADVVLAPCSFAVRTIRDSTDKEVRVAAYGVDTEKWFPAEEARKEGPLRFLCVGHVSIRKGSPFLFRAWHMAGLSDARLVLVGPWHLAEARKRCLPRGIHYVGCCSQDELRRHYQGADVFVFPSYFEGFGLVVGEAMACGLPVVASDASAASDIVDGSCGRVFPAGDLDALVEHLRFFGRHREQLPEMKRAARARAERQTWDRYRRKVSEAVEAYC